jgi:Protein of unknown function DUF262
MLEPTIAKPLIPESSTSESMRVDSVLKDFKEGAVQIPDYQRDSDQWDETTKSLLIESIINNLSIPAFFFEVTVGDDGVERNQVIDGQQRLTTLSNFYEQKFRMVPSQEAPYISPNSVHYAGKTFDELPLVYRQAFERYRLAIIKLRDLKGMRLEVFRRINQGGTPLSGQDIRLAYYGEKSPAVTFIRLVGIYDQDRQASQRFIGMAADKFAVAYPWIDETAREAWQDTWTDKALARGQTASEMFLWSLMAAQYDKLDNLLQNPDALRKLNVRFNKGIDEALDAYCAQLHFQDNNSDVPSVLLSHDQMRDEFFPCFQGWIAHLGASGPSLDVRKNRTVASLIGASFRERVDYKEFDKDTWGRVVEFIRKPTEKSAQYGIEWPQSKGRWDGGKGYRSQLEAACALVKAIAK